MGTVIRSTKKYMGRDWEYRPDASEAKYWWLALDDRGEIDFGGDRLIESVKMEKAWARGGPQKERYCRLLGL